MDARTAITINAPQDRVRSAWQEHLESDPGSVARLGSVDFKPAPGGHGTEVHIVLGHAPPGGALGSAVAKAFGRGPGQASEELRRFKQVVETGEVARTDGVRA